MSGCKASTVFFCTEARIDYLCWMTSSSSGCACLIDNTTLSCLPPMCFWDTFESASSLSARHSYLYEPSNSMWIQNDVTPLKSHAWAEVTRCRESGDSPTDETLTKRHWEHLPWFYHAPGSGQSIHIGRTLVMPYHPFNMSEQFMWAQAGAYDSVQFLDRPVRRAEAESATTASRDRDAAQPNGPALAALRAPSMARIDAVSRRRRAATGDRRVRLN